MGGRHPIGNHHFGHIDRVTCRQKLHQQARRGAGGPQGERGRAENQRLHRPCGRPRPEPLRGQRHRRLRQLRHPRRQGKPAETDRPHRAAEAHHPGRTECQRVKEQENLQLPEHHRPFCQRRARTRGRHHAERLGDKVLQYPPEPRTDTLPGHGRQQAVAPARYQPARPRLRAGRRGAERRRPQHWLLRRWPPEHRRQLRLQTQPTALWPTSRNSP